MKKNIEPHIQYSEIETSTESNRVDAAFDVLFEEVLKRLGTSSSVTNFRCLTPEPIQGHVALVPNQNPPWKQ
ncbi:MAG: hypothetical protein WC887_00585 [Candidatus Paceibacterota bacterium]|jgi:hypothetical protein